MVESSEPDTTTCPEPSRKATAFTSSSWAPSMLKAGRLAWRSYAATLQALVPATSRVPSRLMQMDHTPKRSPPSGSGSGPPRAASPGELERSTASWMSVTFCTDSKPPPASRFTSRTTGLIVE